MQLAVPTLPLRTGTAELAAHAGVAGGYFLAVQLGMYFLLPQVNLSLIWPATGVALAVVYLLGLRFAATVVLSAFVAHAVLGEPIPAAAAVAVGVGVAAIVGSRLLSYSGFSPRFERVSDLLGFVFLGALVTGAINSLVTAGVMHSLGMTQWQGFVPLWWVCWVADAMGILLLGPVLLGWALAPALAASRRLQLEQAALLALVIVAAWAVYSGVLPPGLAMSKPLSYIVFPLMIWAAVRCAPKETALLLFAHAVVAMAYTSAGHGPFAESTLQENLLSLHAHLGMLSITTLLLASAMAERRVAEQTVRESESKYRLMVENQTDLVVKMDREGYIVFASPTVAEVFGETPERLIGRAFRQLVGGADETDPDCPWSRLFAPPWSCYLEQSLPTPGGPRWFGWAAKAMMEEDGRPCAVVAVGRDITERRRAEDESRQHLEELAHVGRISAMGEMAAGLAHELNQPLCAVTTYAQACRRLLGPEADPELTSAMERIAANAQRAGEIIRQMRSFVRKDDPSPVPADINTVIEDVLHLTAAELRRGRVQVDVDLADGLPAVAITRIQIQQVLVNLIRNAVEAMCADSSWCEGRLLVSSSSHGPDGVEVVVADTGPGLPLELKENLFDPFVTGKADGMGLGLSISRSIVDSHDGRLTAANRPQGGAEFRVFLPAATADQTEAD